MTKSTNKSITKRKTTTKKVNSSKKVSTGNKKVTNEKTSIKENALITHIKNRKRPIFITLLLIFLLGLLLIASSYAWFSTTLNVKIKTFNMVVTRNEGLALSHDAVTYTHIIEISKELLYDNLADTYPNHRTMWNANGLIPVSTNGNPNPNTYFFDVYTSGGVLYRDYINRLGGIMSTELYDQSTPKKYSYFLAFDLFFLNDTDSPEPDNLYFDYGTGVQVNMEVDEEMQGLINSMRLAIIKVGSIPKDATPEEVQNIQCNNDCEAIIFEPFQTQHTQMAIDNAARYDIELVDGKAFPTYASVQPVYRRSINDLISGSPTLDTEVFNLQETITESDFKEPLFKIPDGFTKTRVYAWIEGQDIDSFETLSNGANVDISLNFVKDTFGQDVFNE